MSPYGTHLPLLLKLVSMTKGDVLELGIGSQSTPALNSLCLKERRHLVSYDSDPQFIAEFCAQYASYYHQFHWVSDWDSAEIEKPWSVVLVDHRPARRRYRDAARVAEHAEFTVCHDTEEHRNQYYHWQRAFRHYKYRFDDDRDPRTTVLSNFHDLSFLKEGDSEARPNVAALLK